MNMDAPAKPRVALIAGPTASGKSALALRLAEMIGGTIVNADASQVYRDLRLLSARPSAEEEARAPHRLFGTRDGATACSAADWASDAAREIDAALAGGSVPILVGGTGLYIRTLLDGIAPVPEIDQDVRAAVRRLPTEEAFRALSAEDPAGAARLRPGDTARIARALEVVRATRRPLAAWQAERSGGIGDRVETVALTLLPPREWLHARIATRFEAMIDAGAAGEVSALLARGLDPALPAMRAIGVREVASWLQGEIDRPTMLAAGTAATRQYAKRQYTWFRHQLESDRVTLPPNDEELANLAILLRAKLLT